MINDGAPFIHPKALVESENLGPMTRIWAFSHILPGAKIGRDCNICDHCFVENDVVIGDRVTVKCGVQIWDGLRIDDDVFIGPNVTFTNDRFPRSKQYPEKFTRTELKKGASIGANATILPGITVGANSMVGAGSVVTRSVPPNAIVMGNPARIAGYTQASTQQPAEATLAPDGLEMKVKGVRLLTEKSIKDLRGSLSVREVGKGLPFVPKRYFVIHDVPSQYVRGEHAHKVLEQLLVCLKGSVRVMVDDGEERQEVILASANDALYIPPLVWGVQYKYSQDAVLLVLASHEYDPDDYLRDYEEFLSFISSRNQ